MDTGAGAKAGEELIADPDAGCGVDGNGIHHACSDGEDDGADDHEGFVDSDEGDGGADGDRGEDDGDEIWDGADAGVDSCGAFDGLEVEWEVEDVCVECHV